MSIGEAVTIAQGACLHVTRLRPGNRTLVGIGATVLDGALVDDEVIIAAGQTFEIGVFIVANPCKQATGVAT